MAKNRSLDGFEFEEEKPPLPPSLRPTRVLVIAVDDYCNGIVDLKNPVGDAKEFIRIICENYQIDAAKVTTLFNAEASLENIFAAFEKIVNEITADENFIFWFSGHGELYTPTGRGYWIPADGRPNVRPTWLSNNAVKDFLESMQAHHVFGIVDSCFSGTLFRKMPPENTQIAEKLDALPSRYLLTSGRETVVSDGREGAHSPFAQALFNHLQNNPNAALPVSELATAVKLSPSLSANRETPRGSHLPIKNSEGGEFIFYKKGFVPQVAKTEIRRPITDTRRVNSATPPTAVTPLPTAAEPQIPNDLKGFIKEIRTLIGDGKTEKVFDIFEKHIDPDRDIYNDLLLLQSRRKRLLREKRSGLVSDSHYSVSSARIEHSLLSYVSELEQKDLL